MSIQNPTLSSIDNQEISALRQEIINQLDSRIEDVLASFPTQYFRQLGDAERLEHFKALVAIKVCDIDQEIKLKQQDGSRVSVVSTENYPGQLAELIAGLPDEYPLVGAQVFTTSDESFIVDVFEFQTSPNKSVGVGDSPSNHLNDVIAQVIELTGESRPTIEAFIDRYQQDHQIFESPEEIAHQFSALQETEHINDIKVLWKEVSASATSPCTAKITISAASSTTREVILRAAAYFGKCKYDIRRAICENVIVRNTTDVALLTFHLVCPASEQRTPEQRCRDIETFLRLDEEVITPIVAGQLPPVDIFSSMENAELFCAMGRLTQHAINFCQPKEISHERVMRVLLKQPAFIDEVLSHFQSRFKDDFDSKAASEIQESFTSTLDAINAPTDQMITRKFVDLSLRIQRCNLFIERRRVIAFRVPGDAFENLDRGESPYAVFYVFGAGFDGFHVRFRDVARGGMRLVPTRNREHYLFESSRVFDEAWRLAAAQQLKNKDIAEGGAKACVVVKPTSNHEKAGRDFADGLLDLIIDPPRTGAADLKAKEYEYLYLGPDENVSNDLINWIVERSAERKYAFPATIMSSKPAAGINHKAYGVTSEGVLVFLRHALIERGINPDSDPFSVKLTGGPDGDVGGNAIRILIRDYKQQVKIVGVSDGTGSAVDPAGLDHDELLRLVGEELGIVSFAQSALSPQGSVMGLEDEAQVTRRNQLHNQVLADVFLPAGGRPSTINSTNWQDFLDDQGKPTARIVIEGANLFLTEEARAQLSGAGVTIVKDSSANKCGVICSSLEIIAGMQLSESQFMEIKPTYVKEVLHLLRDLAGTEAISLFNEQLRQPGLTLPEISVLLSKQIIRVADSIHRSLPNWNQQEQDIADQFVEAFLPASLVQTFQQPLAKQIPSNYRRHLISAVLSSRIVYREGIQNLATMQEAHLEQLIRSHVVYEHRVSEMIGQLSTSELPDKELMMQLLDHAGARSQRELRTSKR